VTDEEAAERFSANLRTLARSPGSAVLVEQPPTPDLTGGIRWWRCERFDLVRTGDGSFWLVLPPGSVVHPPLMGRMLENVPTSVIDWAARKGAAVVPAELPFARDLELRLVAGVRR
jgi:hypothetical protein